MDLNLLYLIRDVSRILTIVIPFFLSSYALLNRYRRRRTVYSESIERIHRKADDVRREIDEKINEWLAKHGTFKTSRKKPVRASSNPVDVITPVGKGESGWIVKIRRKKK